MKVTEETMARLQDENFVLKMRVDEVTFKAAEEKLRAEQQITELRNALQHSKTAASRPSRSSRPSRAKQYQSSKTHSPPTKVTSLNMSNLIDYRSSIETSSAAHSAKESFRLQGGVLTSNKWHQSPVKEYLDPAQFPSARKAVEQGDASSAVALHTETSQASTGSIRASFSGPIGRPPIGSEPSDSVSECSDIKTPQAMVEKFNRSAAEYSKVHDNTVQLLREFELARQQERATSPGHSGRATHLANTPVGSARLEARLEMDGVGRAANDMAHVLGNTDTGTWHRSGRWGAPSPIAAAPGWHPNLRETAQRQKQEAQRQQEIQNLALRRPSSSSPHCGPRENSFQSYAEFTRVVSPKSPKRRPPGYRHKVEAEPFASPVFPTRVTLIPNPENFDSTSQDYNLQRRSTNGRVPPAVNALLDWT
ncbi:hypothetical protein CYMTET_42507 [Cymbomonas tetramitiformis]|uniref:Uncharacterized protein n=1 Tax=Cymbomonas tetramitiformis TaxID=36881 RepID=A0AAE0C5B3_9CHLO|nr:hypothetical protein CYMTET_42507 [Cymbomonas tetramitiformis]